MINQSNGFTEHILSLKLSMKAAASIDQEQINCTVHNWFVQMEFNAISNNSSV